MTNKTSGTKSAAVTGAWQETPEWLTPSVGWGGATGHIRTSCHLWRPPRQTWEWAWETERSGTSWQSDPGPVAPALAMQCQSMRAQETGQGHSNCLPQSALAGERTAPCPCGQLRAQRHCPLGGIDLETYSRREWSWLVREWHAS